MSQEQYNESLKTIVAEKLNGIPNFNEDIKYVAEYIVLLISNGGTVEGVVTELSTLFDTLSTETLMDVVQTTFFALEALQQGEPTEVIVAKIREMNAAAAGQGQPQAQVAPAIQEPSFQDSSSMDTTQEPEATPKVEVPMVSAFANVVSVPTGPSSSTPAHEDFQFRDNFKPQRGGRGGSRGGIGKNGRGGARGGARGGIRNNTRGTRFNPLARALGMADDENVNFVRHKKEGRCKVFPHCPLGKSCPHAHPTKVCENYPNCPNPPGTCEYLHPSEDEELMKEIEKTREEFRQRRDAMLAARTKPIQTGIVLCKFGAVCSNPSCPFGHPTPANEDAKVIDLMWCANNLECKDPQCKKAHSSISKIKPVQPMGGAKKPTAASATPFQSAPASHGPVEKVLEQCKYGTRCTNKRCKFRHARSHVMCRDGANCTRLDCLFSHPINEDCRFGIDCKNPNCLFRHPEGRQVPNGNNNAQPGFKQQIQIGPTNERAFALPEGDHIQAAPNQDGQAPFPSVSEDADMN